jgi:hypothetical protein
VVLAVIISLRAVILASSAGLVRPDNAALISVLSSNCVPSPYKVFAPLYLSLNVLSALVKVITAASAITCLAARAVIANYKALFSIYLRPFKIVRFCEVCLNA